MKHQRISDAFFCLLQVGLWTRYKDEKQVFPLSDGEWFEVLQMARQQTVEGIIYEGLRHLDPEFLPPSPIRIKCMLIMDKIERQNRRQVDVIGEQTEFFKKHGLHPVLLKGQGVAVHYAVPELRMSGDIDWYFENSHEYAKAQLLLNKRGTAVATINGQVVYQWKGFELDLHRRLFDVFNPVAVSRLSRLKKSYANVKLEMGGQQVVVLSPMIQIIQVTMHILKHCLAFGLGLRQFCDLACLYHRYTDQLDERELRKVYKRLGILRWIEAVHQLLVEYIGLDQDKLPFPIASAVSAQPILEDILNSGNFGFHNNNYIKMKNGQFAGRKQQSEQFVRRLLKYARYAPLEACWFPIVQLMGKNRD